MLLNTRSYLLDDFFLGGGVQHRLNVGLTDRARIAASSVFFSFFLVELKGVRFSLFPESVTLKSRRVRRGLLVKRGGGGGGSTIIFLGLWIL